MLCNRLLARSRILLFPVRNQNKLNWLIQLRFNLYLVKSVMQIVYDNMIKTRNFRSFIDMSYCPTS